MSVEDITDRELDRLRRQLESGRGGLWERLRRSRPTLIVLTVVVACLQLRRLPARLSSTTLDAAALIQSKTAPANVRLVTINKEEYATLFSGTSPLNPAMLEKLLIAIAKGHPALIVVDLDTSHPMFRALDEPKDTRIVWGVTNEDDIEQQISPAKPLGGADLPANWSTALALIPNDDRGVVRSYRRWFPVLGGARFPSIEFAAAEAYRPHSTPALDSLAPSGNIRLLDFRYRFYPTPATFVLQNSESPGWSEGILRNRVVVLGGSYPTARDGHATPVGLADGAELVSQGIEAEIANTGIPPANPWMAGILQVFAGLAIVAVYHRFRLRTALFISLLLIPLLSLIASLIVFHRLSLWAPLIPVLVAVVLTELYSKAVFFLTLCENLSERIDTQAQAVTPEGPVAAKSEAPS